jgi:predicted  nucleic acid-binding Zn-ribbon protein
MPQYQYRCDGCGSLFTTESREITVPCPVCGLRPKRVWAFTHSPSMQEHFNHSIGKYVSNKRDFYDGLKRQSDDSSERMGMDVDLQPLSPSDMAEASSHGVTEEGLDVTRQAMHDSRLA